jgi:PPOX class probable F420-dependent enzyme
MPSYNDRERFAAARVAVLGTADAQGVPHLVPVTFVVAGDTVWSATDGKPKKSTELKRHANIREQPRVSLLVQHWDEDWSRLWWVRADGLAVVTGQESTVQEAVARLRHKYGQYQQVTAHGPVIEVTVQRWRGWYGTAPPAGPSRPR